MDKFPPLSILQAKKFGRRHEGGREAPQAQQRHHVEVTPPTAAEPPGSSSSKEESSDGGDSDFAPKTAATAKSKATAQAQRAQPRAAPQATAATMHAAPLAAATAAKGAKKRSRPAPPTTLDLMLPARTQANNHLIEVRDPGFTLEGDVGVVGRVCQPQSREPSTRNADDGMEGVAGARGHSPLSSPLALDMRGTVYDLHSTSLPVSVLVVQAAPGGAVGNVMGVFSSVTVAEPTGNEGTEPQDFQFEDDDDDDQQPSRGLPDDAAAAVGDGAKRRKKGTAAGGRRGGKRPSAPKKKPARRPRGAGPKRGAGRA